MRSRTGPAEALLPDPRHLGGRGHRRLQPPQPTEDPPRLPDSTRPGATPAVMAGWTPATRPHASGMPCRSRGIRLLTLAGRPQDEEPHSLSPRVSATGASRFSTGA